MKVRSTVPLSRVKRKTSNERRYTNGYSPSPNRCKGSRCRGQQYPASSCKARKSAEVLLPTGTLTESTSALNTVWTSSCPRDRHGPTVELSLVHPRKKVCAHALYVAGIRKGWFRSRMLLSIRRY